MELTIAFETLFDAAVLRTRLKYEDITAEVKRNGFLTTLITTSRGESATLASS